MVAEGEQRRARHAAELEGIRLSRGLAEAQLAGAQPQLANIQAALAGRESAEAGKVGRCTFPRALACLLRLLCICIS